MDTVRPTATILVAVTSLGAGSSSLVTITFSEAVTGFTNGDLLIANGTLSAVSSSNGGVTWTATLTPSANLMAATNVITLDNTGVLDGAGNVGTGSTTSNNYAIDTVPTPTLTFTTPSAVSVAVGATLTNAVTSTLSGGSYGAISYTSSQLSKATVHPTTGVVTGLAIGTTTITATQAAASGFNATTSTSYTLTVTIGTPTISVALTASGITYGQTLAASTLSGGTASVAGTFAFTTTSTAPGAGTAAPGVRFTPTDTTNYTSTTTTANVTVAKATLTVTADNQTKLYGAANPAFTATLTGFVNSETLDTSGVTGTASVTTTATNVGSAALTAAVGTLVSANYAFTFTNGVLTISQANAAVALSNLAQTYNGAPRPVSVTTSPTGLSVAVTYDGNSVAPVNAGSYAVLARVNDGGNYVGTVVGALTVAKAAQTIAFTAPATATLGKPVTLAATASSGLPVTFAVTGPAALSGSTLTFSAAGTATVTATQAGDGNTSAATATVTVTAGKAEQTIAFTAPATTTFGKPVTLAATASSGLPVTLAVTGPAVLSGSTLTFSAAGTVTVTATQAGDGNTLPATATATVTVTVTTGEKQIQTIAFTPLGDRVSTAGSFALNATASSGLPVTFAIVSGPALLAGTTVDLTGAAGLVVIRAAQVGNLIYGAAPDVTRAFTVSAPVQAVYFGNVSAAGSTAKSGDVAAVIPPGAKQGALLFVAPGVGVNTFLDFTLNPDGTFNQTITIAAAPVLAQGASTERLPAVAAAPMTLTVRGSLVNGRLQGVIEPLGLAFSAPVQPTAGPSASAAGFYTSSTLATTSGATYSVVGTNNQVLGLATTRELTTGGLTSLAADGTFSVQTQTANGPATIRGAVDEAATSVSGSITLPGQAETTFAGLRTTTTRTDRLINLSSRLRIGAGINVLIAGFVIGGTEAKQVLIRGIGPALAGLGVQGTLANPQLRLYRGSEVIAQNDDWSTGADSAALASAFQRLGAFALAPGSKDAALLVTLAPGAYTAHVVADAAGGVALAEIYDASGNPNADYQRLINLSTRGDVGTGENILIGGFIVTGNAPKRVLVRAVGPSLTAFGVAGAIVDPRLRVFTCAALIAENDNWSIVPADTAATVQAARDTGAFALANGSKDAALILTLAPGAYTAQVSCADGASAAPTGPVPAWR
ncbi:MAG: Ig-like domain-containing protein [Verrucomicrobia bacterium]|nr:Ig-like domain-containing protein [Verrucomicrobiota bacterium]